MVRAGATLEDRPRGAREGVRSKSTPTRGDGYPRGPSHPTGVKERVIPRGARLAREAEPFAYKNPPRYSERRRVDR